MKDYIKASLPGFVLHPGNPKPMCIMPISVFQEYESGDKFKSIILAINANFSSCEIIIGDTLQRHNFLLQGETAEKAEALARKKGDQWIEENQETLKLLKITCKISRWDDWHSLPEYKVKRSFIDEQYNTNAQFKSKANDAVREFIHKNKGSKKESSPTDEAQTGSAYILEELAVFLLWNEKFRDKFYFVYPMKFSEISRIVATAFRHLPGMDSDGEKRHLIFQDVIPPGVKSAAKRKSPPLPIDEDKDSIIKEEKDPHVKIQKSSPRPIPALTKEATPIITAQTDSDYLESNSSSLSTSSGSEGKMQTSLTDLSSKFSSAPPSPSSSPHDSTKKEHFLSREKRANTDPMTQQESLTFAKISVPLEVEQSPKISQQQSSPTAIVVSSVKSDDTTYKPFTSGGAAHFFASQQAEQAEKDIKKRCAILESALDTLIALDIDPEEAKRLTSITYRKVATKPLSIEAGPKSAGHTPGSQSFH